MGSKSGYMAIIALGGLALLSGCDDVGKILAGEADIVEPSYAPLPKTSSWSGQMSRAESLQYVTAHDDLGWQKLWAIVGQPPPLASLPKGWMGVAVFLGQRPTTGYDVQITSVYDQWAPGLPDILVVRYVEIMPPKNLPVPQAAPGDGVKTRDGDAASGQVHTVTQAPKPSLTSPWVIRLAPAQKFDPEYQKG